MKGRHPLLKDVDITVNSTKGLALVEGKAVEERGKVIRQLGYNWSDASSGYQSTRFIKKKLEESHSSFHTDLISQSNSQSKSQLEDKGSLEIEVGVLNQTSSISEDMGEKHEVRSENTEKGQVLRTAEVVMNILDMTNPGTLTEEEKKKVILDHLIHSYKVADFFNFLMLQIMISFIFSLHFLLSEQCPCAFTLFIYLFFLLDLLYMKKGGNGRSSSYEARILFFRESVGYFFFISTRWRTRWKGHAGIFLIIIKKHF